MSEPHPLGWDPAVVAGADQEMAQTSAWLRGLADLHPQAVQQLGNPEAMIGLAAHIRDTIKKNTKEPDQATGWGIAAIAIGLLSDHLHPPAELPPLVVRPPDPPRQRYTDARGECSCHIDPPCHWCETHCCADHFDACLVGYPPPCCDKCPDEGD